MRKKRRQIVVSPRSEARAVMYKLEDEDAIPETRAKIVDDWTIELWGYEFCPQNYSDLHTHLEDECAIIIDLEEQQIWIPQDIGVGRLEGLVEDGYPATLPWGEVRSHAWALIRPSTKGDWGDGEVGAHPISSMV